MKRAKDIGVLLAIIFSVLYLVMTIIKVNSLDVSESYAAPRKQSGIEKLTGPDIKKPDSRKLKYVLSEEEIDLLARVVAAEAEGTGFTAKYYVACVVLNRVESDCFPNSISEVVWQTEPVEQFVSMWDGRFESCEVTDTCYTAVQYLIRNGNELPEDVLYFTSGEYQQGTDGYIQIDDMFYSSEKE